MSKHVDAFKILLDLAIQKGGMFRDSQSVVVLHEAHAYFIGLEGDFEQICNVRDELEKELMTLKGMPDQKGESGTLSDEEHDKYFPGNPKRVSQPNQIIKTYAEISGNNHGPHSIKLPDQNGVIKT
jgi:hypothetical protein